VQFLSVFILPQVTKVSSFNTAESGTQLHGDKKQGQESFSPSASHSLDAVMVNTRGKAAELRDLLPIPSCAQSNIFDSFCDTNFSGIPNSSLKGFQLTITLDFRVKIAWITATSLAHEANEMFNRACFNLHISWESNGHCYACMSLAISPCCGENAHSLLRNEGAAR